MNKKRFWTIMVSAVAIALLAPFASAGSFVHQLTVLMGLIFVSLPLAVASLIVYARNRKKQDHPQRLAKGLATVALALFIQSLSLPIMAKMEGARVRAGKNYCESLIPAIEQYRQAHAAYPEELGQLPASPAPPTFLANQYFYHGGPDGYNFFFHTPGSFMLAYHYDSEDKQWLAED